MGTTILWDFEDACKLLQTRMAGKYFEPFMLNAVVRLRARRRKRYRKHQEKKKKKKKKSTDKKKNGAKADLIPCSG